MPSSTSTHSLSQEMQDTNAIGGGAINEKQRLYKQSSAYTTNNIDDSNGNNDTDNQLSHTWNPNEHLSHMLHALVGLERYPNYLSRFKDISGKFALVLFYHARYVLTYVIISSLSSS